MSHVKAESHERRTNEGDTAPEVENDETRAKQAISPAGLGDQSVEGNSGVGSETDVEDVPPTELEDKYMDGNGVAANVRETHPNRGGDKPDLNKPSYGGGH